MEIGVRMAATVPPDALLTRTTAAHTTRRAIPCRIGAEVSVLKVGSRSLEQATLGDQHACRHAAARQDQRPACRPLLALRIRQRVRFRTRSQLLYPVEAAGIEPASAA